MVGAWSAIGGRLAKSASVGSLRSASASPKLKGHIDKNERFGDDENLA
jgi:hypothetical protein